MAIIGGSHKLNYNTHGERDIGSSHYEMIPLSNQTHIPSRITVCLPLCRQEFGIMYWKSECSTFIMYFQKGSIFYVPPKQNRNKKGNYDLCVTVVTLQICYQSILIHCSIEEFRLTPAQCKMKLLRQLSAIPMLLRL